MTKLINAIRGILRKKMVSKLGILFLNKKSTIVIIKKRNPTGAPIAMESIPNVVLLVCAITIS
jgi:hypothetical protein